MVNRPTLADSDSDWEEEATIKQSYNPRTYAELILLLYSILLHSTYNANHLVEATAGRDVLRKIEGATPSQRQLWRQGRIHEFFTYFTFHRGTMVLLD